MSHSGLGVRLSGCRVVGYRMMMSHRLRRSASPEIVTSLLHNPDTRHLHSDTFLPTPAGTGISIRSKRRRVDLPLGIGLERDGASPSSAPCSRKLRAFKLGKTKRSTPGRMPLEVCAGPAPRSPASPAAEILRLQGDQSHVRRVALVPERACASHRSWTGTSRFGPGTWMPFQDS